MKVLFAVNNDKISEAVIKKYPKDYKELLSYKNVYYFNAILKEIQNDKSYDRIVISEDLEPFVNTNHDSIDNFIFNHLDKISDEAQGNDGKEISIILICSERRSFGSSILNKLFSIGIYNALIGNDRSMDNLCKLINRPRTKKEAKLYYRIDQATYESAVDNGEVSETEIQNILNHFKKLGKSTDRYTDSFNNIAAQYTDEQLRLIINVLPMKVKAVLESESQKYQALMGTSGGNKQPNIQQQEPGIRVNTIGNGSGNNNMNGPIVIPSGVKRFTGGTRPIIPNNTGSRQPVQQTQARPQSTIQQAQVRPQATVQQAQARPQATVQQAQVRPQSTIQQAQVRPQATVQQAQARPQATVQQAQVRPQAIVQQAQVRPQATVQQAQVRPQATVQQAQARPQATVQQAQARPQATVQQVQAGPQNSVQQPNIEQHSQTQQVPEHNGQRYTGTIAQVKRTLIARRKVAAPLPENTVNNPLNDIDYEDEMNEVEEVKRGRGRPRKIVDEQEVKPKGKRGRPRKNAIENDNNLENLLGGIGVNSNSQVNDMMPGLNSEDKTDEGMLPGLDGVEEDGGTLPGLDDVEEDGGTLPGLDDVEEDGGTLPGFDDVEEDGGTLPGLDDVEDDGGMLPGFDDVEEDGGTLPGFDDVEDEGTLPGLNDVEEDGGTLPGLNDAEEDGGMLPGFDDVEEDGGTLPGLNDVEEDGGTLPGLDDSEGDGEEVDVNSLLAGLDDEDDNGVLPGLESNKDEDVLPGLDNDDGVLPGLDDSIDENSNESFFGLNNTDDAVLNENQDNQEETLLTGMGFENEEDDFSSTTNNIGGTEESNSIESIKPQIDYSMSNLNSLLSKDKKIVAFLGATKNGTSFLINNLALMFSMMGIDTAILDMTKNRNSYYLFTDSREELRKIAYTSLSKLENGYADGIKFNKSLTVYTGLPSDTTVYENAEPILSTLVQNHSLVLIDTDFYTPPAYFASSQEIYLVQSMDILTIQPLTSFLRELKFKGAWEPEKARVVINKEVPIRILSSKTIIGGMSRYNGPDMSVMTDLFNKDMVKACSIPFDEKVYAKYLETLATCKLSISSLPKQFRAKLQILGEMVYPRLNSKTSYNPPSMNGANYNKGNAFSSNTNNTLNKMKKNF